MISSDVGDGNPHAGTLGAWLRVAARRRLSLFLPLVMGAGIAGIVATASPPVFLAEAVVALDARKIQFVDIGSVVSRLPDESSALRTELDAIASRSMAALVARRLDFGNRPDLLAAMREPRPKGLTDWFDLLQSSVRQLAEWTRESGNPQVEVVMDAVRPSWVAGRDAITRALVSTAAGEQDGDSGASVRPPPEGDIVDWLLGGLRVSNDGRSFTIYVAFADHDPLIAAEIANAYATTYLDDMVGMKVRAARDASTWLKGRLDELRAELEAAETAVLRFRREAGLTEFRGDTIGGQQITELNSQLGLVRAERARTDARIQAARASSRQDAAASGLGDIASSPLIDTLRREIADIDARLADLRDQGAFRHPDTLALDARRGALARRLDAEIKRAIGVLETEGAALHRHETEIVNTLQSMTSRYGEAGEASIRLNQLKREADANRAIYESFLTRYKETIEQAGLATPEARILSAAEPPSRPSGSGPLPMVALGAFGGLMAGAAFAGLRERFDQRLHDVADVEELVAAPVVGLLPAVSRLRLAPPLLVARRPHAPYSRALKRTHAALRLRQKAARAKVVMVTSATAGEGKTSFCAALARTLALSDLRVLLVDADIHRPCIARALGVEGRPDMQQVVRGEATLERRLQVDPESGAHVLTATVEDGSNLIVSSAGWGVLMDAAREQYDVVIVDTPPVTAVPDAAAVGSHADLNLFLVQWDGPSRRTIAGAVRFLRLCAVRLDGVVITGVRSGFAPRYSDPYELAIRTNARLLEQLRALPPYPRPSPTGPVDGTV